METMLTPSLPSPDDRGKRWLQAQVQQLLAASAVLLATRAEGDPACYWGTGPETETTLYVLLAGDPEPRALPFRRLTIMQCGAGLYSTQHQAVLFIRRTLKKMGILPS
jgi:hypothetical protein